MKVLSLVLLLMASMAFVLVGCSDNSVPIAGPTGQAISSGSAASLAKLGEDLHSATGSGHVSDFGGEKVDLTFTFSAIQHKGGTSSGEVQVVVHPGLKFHGKIFDLKVEDNRAKLSWTYTSGPWTGLYGCAIVEDNGEGIKATGPDKMAGFLWTDGSDIGTYTIPELIEMSPSEFIYWLEYYIFPLIGLPPGTPALVPTDKGNVQVR
jgi:hypothetical protein